ncbi:MAG: aminotransferase class III-fold pyridoxal phosphate-dependent enzyme [Nitrospinae bacterium]|nr:aminotransferase class III-fold pyridoxal phosphate-dependent enzyme [Nitrospinota bacterium]
MNPAIAEAESLRTMDKEHVWHPLMNHSGMEENPLDVVVKARGSTIQDASGKEYIDAMAGLWCVNIGYGRDEVARAAYEQMLELAYYPLTQVNPPAAKLADRLASLLPDGVERVWFVNSGSEAVDTAIKLARAYGRLNGGRRYKIIARHQGYHGATIGGASLTGQTLRRAMFEPLLPGVIHVSAPYFYRSNADTEEELAARCADELDEVIRYEDPETVAAFIAEPVIGGGGVIPPPADYLKRMREVCRKHGVLFIADEVITGFGRTGQLFASDLYEIAPDIMTMAKGLSSAYLPIGATATTNEIFEALNAEGDSGFLQINTYGGHPVACAASLKNLEIMMDEELPARGAKVGAYLGGLLGKLSDIPCVGDVRGVGLIWGVELIEEDGAPLSTAATAKVLAYAKEQGVIFGKNAGIAAGPSNTVTISPPLVLTEEEAERAASVLDAALRRVQAESGS